LGLPEFWYWARKVQARFFAGDYASAVEASLNAQRLLWTSPSQFETATFRFYGALSHAASWDSASPDQRQQHFEALAAHHRQLEIWAEHCPENFGNRAALVGGEIARIEGREFDAMRLYKRAIISAHTNGFVHNEGLAYEVAGRFYAARGFDKIAYAYLREARYCYLRWGAAGKVRQLDQLYPHLGEEEPAPGPTSTIEAPVEQLDLATVIKVSQAVSGEIVLEKLIDTLMRTAIEHAGAERGLLILPRGDELRIEAEATTGGDTVIVRVREASVAALPESIVHYVVRTQESVILDDASAENPFSADTYIRQHHSRSILCLPLLKQAKLIGVLYLENNLTSHVFTPNRIALLKVLASQAAISLENTHLYRDLEKAFEEIKDLKDQLYKENLALREQIDQAFMFEEIVGSSHALQGVLSSIVKVAPTDSTVLITGKTGTGKELIARAIHKRSRRSGQAFISVNCASIPSSLIASELFGHEKGAFTGALQRRLGRFELAEGGTIFLDEIGELPSETQNALLRVLQEREFERVGGTQTIRANVRVIAATNRDLKAAMITGAFRSDLFYRLNVFPIEMPPLRQRKEDIPMLVEYFIDRYATKAGKKIRSMDKTSLELLQSYPWPGNIRELQNVIERSVIVCESQNLVVDENWLTRESVKTQPPVRPLSNKLVTQEKELIEAALAETKGRVAGPFGAAARLGMPQSTLDSKIRSLKINKHRFKTV
jgi:Nif-specific regulatory protein